MADTQRINKRLRWMEGQAFAGASGRRIWPYAHATDTLADMLAAGYFGPDKIGNLSVKAGDGIIAMPAGGSAPPTILPISGVTNGVATVGTSGAYLVFEGSGGTVDQSAELAAKLTAAKTLGIPLIQRGVALVNTNIQVEVDEGQALEWYFETGAKIISTHASAGVITINSEPVLTMELAAEITIGQTYVPVTDASSLQIGDFVRVNGEIAYSLDGQNRSKMYGTVTYIDTVSSPNRIYLDSSSYYVDRPAGEIEYSWDGTTTSFLYRSAFADPAAVKVLDDGVDISANCSFAQASPSNNGVDIIINSSTPAAASVVKVSRTARLDFVEVYRSGDVFIDKFHWQANWSEISTGSQRRVLNLVGMSGPHLRDPKFINIDDSLKGQPYNVFGRPEFVSGLTANLFMERPYVRGGGYSIRPEGYGTLIHDLTAEHVYKPIDENGATHSTRVIGLTVNGADQPFSDHGAKNLHYEKVRARQCLNVWKSRGTGITVIDAEVEVLGDSTDQGGGQNFLVADPSGLVIAAMDPLGSYNDSANFEALRAKKIYRNIRLSGAGNVDWAIGNLYRLELDDIHIAEGTLDIDFDGAGPPQTLRAFIDKLDMNGGTLDLRGAVEIRANDCHFGNVERVHLGIASPVRSVARGCVSSPTTARPLSTAVAKGVVYWTTDSGGEMRAYYVWTAGTTSANDPETALGTDPEVLYTDGTAKVVYLGLRVA